MAEAAFPARLGGYDIDLLFQGFPGKSAHNGGLGWSTVALLRGHGRVIMLDTGGIGLRVAMRHRLAELGVACTDVTDVLLTHSHWDHIMNYPMFPQARLHIGRRELAWANSGDASVYAVAEPYTRELAREPQLTWLPETGEVFPAISVEPGPGHTPGHVIVVLAGVEHDILFVQDAAKTRAELASRSTDLTIDPEASRHTIDRIWELWQARAGTILVPGHDLPMVLHAGAIVGLGQRKAAILATFGDSIAAPILIPLTES